MSTLPYPALIEADCKQCNGEGGWHDEDGSIMCFECCGSRRVEVCPVCLTAPDIYTDACECPESKHAAWVAEQLELGREYGWL